MKKIMILGAGRGQMGLYRAAKKLGYKSIATSIDGDYPGFKEADEICIADIIDKEAVADAAERLGVDGIVTACMDAGLLALGATCDRLGLPGISERKAEVSANKFLMKDAFEKHGVCTARYRKVTTEAELRAAVDELGYPLVTKAVDLGGSRGINVVHGEDQLMYAYNETMEATRKDYCIVEEYIDGYECSATAMVAGGKVLFVLPMGDIRYGEDGEIPIGHYVPFEGDKAINDEIVKQVSLAIEAIGLDDCAINADIMLMDGKVYMLELTGRLGANCIPEITSVYYGFDIHEMMLETCVGNYDAVKDFDESLCSSVPCRGEMIISETSGILDGIEYEGEMGGEIEQIWFFLREGDKVNRFRSPKDCLGQAVVNGKSIDDCVDSMKNLMDRVKITYKTN